MFLSLRRWVGNVVAFSDYAGNIRSEERILKMPYFDTKAVRPLAGDIQLNVNDAETLDASARAKDLIRALDQESRALMEHISAKEKGSTPEDSTL